MTKKDVVSHGPTRVEEGGKEWQETHLLLPTHNMDTAGSETIRGGLTPFVLKDDRLVAIGLVYNRAWGFQKKMKIPCNINQCLFQTGKIYLTLWLGPGLSQARNSQRVKWNFLLFNELAELLLSSPANCPQAALISLPRLSLINVV